MKKIKWIIGVPAAIVVIAMAVIYLLLISYDYNQFKAPLAESVQKATGRKLTIGGDIGLSMGLTPALVVESIRFQNADWGSRPDLARIERFEVQVALLPLLSRRIEIQRLIVVSPDILIETDAQGRSNLQFTPATPATPKKEPEKPAPKEGGAALPGLVFNKLSIQNGQLTYRDGRSGKSLKAELKQLEAGAADKDSPISLRLQGSYQSAPFGINGTMGSLAGITGQKAPWPLDLTITAPDTTLGLKGSISDLAAGKGLNLALHLDCQKPSSLAKLAEADLPFDPKVVFSARVSDPKPGTYRISDLKLKLGRSDLSGSISLVLDGARPAVTADLSSKLIDVTEFMPEPAQPPAAEKKKAEGPKKKRVFPSDPLPTEALKSADAAITFSGKQLTLPKIAMTDIALTLALKDGRLTLKPLRAKIGGGTIKGQTTVVPKGKALVLNTQLKVDRFGVGKMLKEMAKVDLFEGELDVDVRLKGRGPSVAGIMAGLNGHTSVIMDGGRISNSLISGLGGDMGAGLFRLLNPFGDKEEYTAINCLVVRFDVRKGLAKASAMVFDTSLMSVIGNGSVDLRTEGLDLSLKPSPKEGIGGGMLGKISLSLGELAKPFKLSGTLAEPKLAIDKAQSALAVGKAAGGVALFGPAGIAAALVSGKTAEKDNPCLSALEIARTGKPAKTAASKSEAKSGTGQKPAPASPLGGVLNKLFGD
jgi:AsmA family protein